MSDLSMPALSFTPIEGVQAAPAPGARASEPYAWPTPPYAAYPAPTRQLDPEPCEIEAPNGSLTRAVMHAFDPDEGLVQVQVPPSRNTLRLRLSQFRRLSLLRPIAARPPVNADRPVADLLGHAAPHVCHLHFRGGGQADVRTVGHVDHAAGLFLFPPATEAGQVLRSFYPRAALAGAEIGERIGELLVEQQSASAEQVEAAATEQRALRRRKLGDLLVVEQIVTSEQLIAAIDQQARMPMVRIGEALRALGFITDEQLEEALRQQQSDRSLPLGELLVRRGVVSRADLQTALARKMGYPMVDVAVFPAQPDAALKLPASVARRLCALPLLMHGGRLVVAFEDPTASNLLVEVEFSAQCKVVPVMARLGTIAPAVDKVYQRLGKDSAPRELTLSGGLFGSGDAGADSANKLVASLEQQQIDLGPSEAQIEQSDNSLVRLINTMILEAQQGGVSDIHVECQPGNEKVRVRFRRDGMLEPYIELPPSYRSAVVARLKIMCDLDISERRKPQDGKIDFGRFVQGQQLELRVATVPTTHGLEDVVLRLLSSARTMTLDEAGLAPDLLRRFRSVIGRPYGMVLCVGPTGSGKTTTLHAALDHINTPVRKIWTAEDPIEITQRGLRQVQINPRIDWTFAKALRAFLRADPDVVMVGEIRDRETAHMAIEASLTGHLLLSTLHTNSAPETITRLLDMGMDPFSFADSLLAVLAQRLVRRVCRHCVKSRPASEEEIDALVRDHLCAYPDPAARPSADEVRSAWLARAGVDGRLMHHRANGCPKCRHTGFSGRGAIHELLVVDRELRRLIQTNARAEQLQVAAMAAGMRTLRQDGIVKVLAGLTSIEEVRAIANG